MANLINITNCEPGSSRVNAGNIAPNEIHSVRIDRRIGRNSMRQLLIGVGACFLAPLILSAQTPPETTKAFEQQTLAINVSQYGINYPEKFVLMQNRMGLRIEYVVDRSRLQLWISPQAGKSMSYKDRNFSNRDDHSDIFERILLPAMSPADFLSCDYDPFHSVLHFKDQTLHIAQVYDKPIVLLWFEKDGFVDLKSAKDDTVIDRSPNLFHVAHPDRGYLLDHVAVIGSGDGAFQHQHALDRGRPTYARAYLKAGQPLAIAAELQSTNITKDASEVLAEGIDATLAANEKTIRQDLDRGRFSLKGRPEMQQLLDKSRRVALSMQDERGFMRSTNQYIYYLLWFRDGGKNTSHLAQSGWIQPARWQADISLRNPNISTQDPVGIFFGQIMAGPITKWEEDGLFYVIWPAFMYWTQTGDDIFTKGAYIKTMEDAMDWLERYSFDAERGLFFRYYYSESMLTGSRDDGYDDATGAPTNRFPSLYQGQLIKKSYDLYINSLNLACYYMLAAMESGERADLYLQKASALEQHLEPFYQTNERLPLYGELVTDKGAVLQASPYGLERGDYQWSFSLPMFQPFQPKNLRRFGNSLYDDLHADPTGMFISAYAAVLTGMDTELYREDQIMAALDYLVPQSVRPGKYLPMGNTVPEIINQKDGDLYHDVRPIVFSIAPWLSAVSNLGIRRLPFGVAVRGTKFLDRIDHYEYQGGLLDVTFHGQGSISRVVVNGRPVENSLQLPEDRIIKGENNVEGEMTPDAKLKDCLIASTVRLDSIEEGRLRIHAFGKNMLTFKGLSKTAKITSVAGEPVSAKTESDGDITWIDFPGRGDFLVMLSAR